MSAHLATRRMDTVTRVAIAAIAGSLSVTAGATIWSSLGPRTPVGVICAALGCIGAAIVAALWALHWPGRGQAVRLTVLGNASIVLTTLSQTGPISAVLACMTFATLASYISLFHTAPLMLYNFVITALVGAYEFVRLAERYGIVAASCGYEVLLILNLAVPFGVQAVVYVLRADALQSERDQLTGLLNRGGFERRAKVLAEKLSEEFGHLVIAVIDLDRFKQLNDLHGHGTGDAALVSVARALRDTSDDATVIGRSGGEEFVIAAGWNPDEVDGRAQMLCEAIARLPFRITASVGTAGARPDPRVHEPESLIAALTVAADDAMYVAKRRGGNQVGHHRAPIPRSAQP
ncbi:MAG: GGDEF domain-containing protein [Actinomycetota bacterium]|uniref:GGDEF domain-containing protein n=1 Tax=Mycobacterium lentiflavum TaxID=141349 RepID=A0ABY3URZ0_MYCLN|nr:GGDEF domain-containing protein [Mycobacterium lentiflavum]MEE3063652.1 GGDEF domain-containing protein [Actinomycetota bacterium]ULP42371.1 GGDEF domain-containing protein [Mycobacterium lentiflavum]